MSLIHSVASLNVAFSVLVLTASSYVSYVVEKTVLRSVIQWKGLF